MAEIYPGFESGPNDEGKKKKSERVAQRFDLPNRPMRHVEKSAGDTPLKFGEDFLRPKPLDPEVFKKTEETMAEKSKQEDAEPYTAAQNGEQLRQASAEDLRARAAREQLDQLHMLQKLESENTDETEEEKKKKRRRLGEAAVASEEPKPEKMHEVVEVEQQKAESEEKPTEEMEPTEQPQSSEVMAEETLAEKARIDLNANAPEIESMPTTEQAETEAAFQDITQRPELADLAAIDASEAAAEDMVQESQLITDDEAFRQFVRNEMDEDPGAATLHELAPDEQLASQTKNPEEPGSFERWMQGHPELASLASDQNETAANAVPTPAATPGRTVPIVLVSANVGGMPAYANAGNQSPNAPNWQSGNQPGNPNQPPGPGGSGGGNFNGPPQNPNVGNPGFPNQPPNPNNVWAPAGNALHPAVWAGMGALAAHQKMNSLRHTAREIGLAGAIGVLGLGLVAEHIGRKRSDRKLKHQIDRQGAALNQTDATLRYEQALHQNTKSRLERLAAAHNTQTPAAHERLPQISLAANSAPQRMVAARHAEMAPTLVPKSAETVAGAGLISAAAAAELAANVAKRPESMIGMTDRQLAKRLERSRQLGKAIRRNPELRDVVRRSQPNQLADYRGAEHAPEWPGGTLPAVVQQQSETISQERHEFQEMVTADVRHLGAAPGEQLHRAGTSETAHKLIAANAANTILDETRHERLGAQTADSHYSGVASANGMSDASLAALSVPIPVAKEASQESDISQYLAAPVQQSKAKELVNSPWAWATVVFVIASLVAAAILLS